MVVHRQVITGAYTGQAGATDYYVSGLRGQKAPRETNELAAFMFAGNPAAHYKGIQAPCQLLFI